MRLQAFVFLRKDGAPLPVGFMGHVGWAFQLEDGTYYGGATENSTGNLVVKPGDDNGWWGKAAGSLDVLVNLFRTLDYDCYKAVTVRSPNPSAAKTVADSTEHRGYIGLTNNCLDHVFDVLTAYGEPGLPFRFQYPSPRSWFAMFNGELHNLKDSAELKRTGMWFGSEGKRGPSEIIGAEVDPPAAGKTVGKTSQRSTFGEYGIAMVRSVFTEECVQRMLDNAVPRTFTMGGELSLQPVLPVTLKGYEANAVLTVGSVTLANPDDICSMDFIVPLAINLTIALVGDKDFYKAKLQVPLHLVVKAEAPAILQVSLPFKPREIVYTDEIRNVWIHMLQAAGAASCLYNPLGAVIAVAALFAEFGKDKIAEVIEGVVKESVIDALNENIVASAFDRRIDLTREVLMQGASRETQIPSTTAPDDHAPLVAPDMDFKAALHGNTSQFFDIYASKGEVVDFLIESRLASEAESIGTIAGTPGLLQITNRHGKKVEQSILNLAMHRSVPALEENAVFTAPEDGRYRCRIMRDRAGKGDIEMSIRQHRVPVFPSGQGDICFDKLGENFIATAIVRELIEDKLTAQLAGAEIPPISLPEKDPVCRIESSVKLENVLTKSGEGVKGSEIVMRALIKLSLTISAKDNIWTALADVRFDFIIRTTISPAAILIAPQPVPDDGVFFDEKNIKHVKGDLPLTAILKVGLPSMGAGIIAEKLNEQLLKAGETKVILAEEVEKKLRADEESKRQRVEVSPVPTMMPHVIEDQEVREQRVAIWPITLEAENRYQIDVASKAPPGVKGASGEYCLYLCNERGAVVGAISMYNTIGEKESALVTILPIWGNTFKLRAFASADCTLTILVKNARSK
ncbi:MAG: hypothetical protein ABL962_08655 [Fimbriimonadaceae bacterium]